MSRILRQDLENGVKVISGHMAVTWTLFCGVGILRRNIFQLKIYRNIPGNNSVYS
jgi:hypothetical protein